MAELPQEMEQLLAELQTEGRLDSSGVFTVDFVRGADKLRQYQLAEPHLYILKLLQSAVSAGASSVSLSSSGSTLAMAYDGRSIEPEHLEGLVNCLLEPLRFSTQPQLVHLAVGLNSSLGCNVDQIIVESWREGQGAALVLTDQLQQSGRVVGRPRQSGTRLFLRKRGLPRLGMFRAELEALTRRGAWCPVPVTLNRQVVNHGQFGRPALPPLLRPFQPLLKAADRLNRFLTEAVMSPHRASVNVMGRDSEPIMPWWVLIWNVEDYVFGQCHRNHHLIERRQLSSEVAASLGLEPLSSASLVHRQGQAPAGPRQYCRQVLALQADLQRDGELALVRDGVLLESKVADFGCSGAVALVARPELTTDLSGFAVVEDDAYRSLVQELKAEFRELKTLLVERLQHDPGATPLGRHVLSRLRRF